QTVGVERHAVLLRPRAHRLPRFVGDPFGARRRGEDGHAFIVRVLGAQPLQQGDVVGGGQAPGRTGGVRAGRTPAPGGRGSRGGTGGRLVHAEVLLRHVQ